MPDLTPKSPLRANFIGFITVFSFTCFFLFYQIFVDSRFERISPKQFIKPVVLAKAARALVFSPPEPQKSTSAKSVVEVQVDCQQDCQFNLIDTQNNSLIKTIPARVDADASGRLQALKLFFSDSQKELIGYQTESLTDPVFYVVNFQADLLQVIKLDLKQYSLEFVDYYPSTQQILFRSTDKLNNHQELFLYAANRPALQIL